MGGRHEGRDGDTNTSTDSQQSGNSGGGSGRHDSGNGTDDNPSDGQKS